MREAKLTTTTMHNTKTMQKHWKDKKSGVARCYAA